MSIIAWLILGLIAGFIEPKCSPAELPSEDTHHHHGEDVIDIGWLNPCTNPLVSPTPV